MPSISANKLGEYLRASPTRRRRIIHDQKHPAGNIVARYRAAVEPLSAFFLSGGKDTGALDSVIVKLRSAPARTPWSAGDNQATADALERVLKLAPKLFANGYRYTAAPVSAPKLSIEGVAVSVQPHFIVTDDRRGSRVGALKLQLVKSDEAALDREGGEYVATLLHQWVAKHGMAGGRAPAAVLCMSVDVFRESLVVAPGSQARRMANITAACQEIAAIWPHL